MLERVVDVVKLIGLSYRGQSEATYTLDDTSIDHGIFLELIIQLRKYDICLKEHLSECIEKSKQLHQARAKGRGYFITLLSKNTVNAVITTIQRIMPETISGEIEKAGMFSVQIHTTQDIASQDQSTVILRYVTNVKHERLVAVVKCEASIGQYFVQLLTEVVEKLKLDMSKCIGNATDGAANMQDQYKGFSALLSTKSPNHVHVCCYAHVLNLVLADTTDIVIASGPLFSHLHDIAVFLRES